MTYWGGEKIFSNWYNKGLRITLEEGSVIACRNELPSVGSIRAEKALLRMTEMRVVS